MQTPEIRDNVVKELTAYFQINYTPESDPGMVWEAHKAVIRGILIKHGSCLKKAREAQITKLLEDIQALAMQHKTTLPSLGNDLARSCSSEATDIRFSSL